MHFGPYSLLLLVAAANGFLLAALLLSPSGRHVGSRWLAALTAAIALRTAPYILGYAGAYDLYPALTFAPFDFTLAWGPLLWAYVTTLATGRNPPRVSLHFVPVALQLAYQLICFALPLAAKWNWYGGAHLSIVEPIGAIAVLISLGAYSLAAWRVYERWQQWLDGNVSNREESRLGWLRIMLLGIAATGSLGLIMMLVHLLVRPLDYFARLPIIVALAGLTYLIGLLGYRYGRGAIAMHASALEPVIQTAVEPSSAQNSPEPRAPLKDYAAQAEEWRELIERNAWHRDSQLTLSSLAEALNTSPRTLSRTLGEGLGVSFNEFINGLRVRDAAERLRQPNAPDVLRVALEVGFSSKASFNRAIKRHTGSTPTDIRARKTGQEASQFPPIASNTE